MKGDTILQQSLKRKTRKTRTKKAAVLFLIFVTALTTAIPALETSAEQASTIDYHPPSGENWNKLRDIAIKDNGWGFGTTVMEEVYLEKNARKIETHDWWADQLAVHGWQSFDLSAYANGTLEFDVAGKTGGENFRIGFRDVVHERLNTDGSFYKDNDSNPEETNIDGQVDLRNYTTVTTEWQHVSIPLQDIFNSHPLFDASKIQLLKLSGDNTPITFWIANLRVTSPDTEKSYAPIKVNQVGYLNYGEKYAHVSGYYNELSAEVGTPFQVKRTSDDSIAYSGALSLVSAYDELSGDKVLKADFSELNEIGEYYINVDGVAEPSVAFEIGPDVYDNLLTDVQKFFYYQRANEDLLPEHAGDFARTGLHKVDTNLPLQSNPSHRKDVSGGWWDAGDTGKYVTAAATAVSDLLWAYESFPHEFSDGQLNIPESGNGISDLLDEIKFETDFFLKMQEETSGGFYAYVIRESAPNRYVMDGTGPDSIIPTSQTATTVGALAHAYKVFKDVPGLEEYANTLLASAIKGWNYLEAHPEFIAQPDGPYNDNEDLNDRFYAAAALYRATGEARYNDFVTANYVAFASKFDQTDFSHGIGSLEMIGFYHYLSGPAPSEDVKNWFVPKYKEWRNKVIQTAIHEAVWRNSTNKGFYWGANSNVASVPVSLDIGSRVIGEYDERMLQVASGNLNYLLGVNPLQLSYITGHGENRVRSTHHEIYMRDFIREMPNGYMPGGPNNNGKFNFPAKAYNQATVDWESNEQALNYNSPLIYLTALLADVENQTFADGIQIDNPSVKLAVGETKTVMASVTPDNASFKKLQAASADEQVAAVTQVTYSEASGMTAFTVTGVAAGRTAVTVQTLDGSIQTEVPVEVVTASGPSDPGTNPEPGQGGPRPSASPDPGTGPTPEPDQGSEPNPGPTPGSGAGSGSGSVPGSSPGRSENSPSGTALGSQTNQQQETLSLSLTRDSLEKAANNAVNGKINLPVQAASGLNKLTVDLPGDWIRTLDTAAVKSISLEALDTIVELDPAFLRELFGKEAQKLSLGLAAVPSTDLSNEERTLLAEGGGTAYELELTVDNAKVQWSGHPVTLKLPYELKAGEHPNQVIVYSLDSRPEIVKNSLYTAETEKAVFQPAQPGMFTAAYADVSFKDIGALPARQADAIRTAAARGIITGKAPGQYDPQGKLTRAEFVQMLVRFFDAADPAAVSKLTDVKKDAWYYSAVASAEKLGIVQGRADGTFGTQAVLTRQEMAVLLHRALLASGGSLAQGELSSPFADKSQISAYAQKAVEALRQANVLSAGAGEVYGPKTQVNRAEAAVLFHDFLAANHK